MEPVDHQQGYGLLFGEIENTAIGLGLDGLAGSEVVPQADRLILYWHGPLPEAIESIIEASGLTVDVRPVPYPPAALHESAKSTFSRRALKVRRTGGRHSIAVRSTVGSHGVPFERPLWSFMPDFGH